MSLTTAPTSLSIFTPTKATALGAIEVLTGKAKSDIKTGADVSVTVKSLFADDDKFIEALEYTGYQTELIQEQLAEIASKNNGGLPDGTRYDESYLGIRDKAKGLMRSEVLRVWAFLKNLYRSVGFPEEEAKAKATAAAAPYKEAQREVFMIMFPMSGEKVVNRY